MKQLVKLTVAGFAAALVVACGGQPKQETPTEESVVVEERPKPDTGAVVETPVETQPLEQDMGFQGHPLDDPDSLLSKRKIYFDFDRSEIKSEFQDIVAAHAEFLAGNPGAMVTLEGHADERGTREYNMALGERRAQAVAEMLTLQGASKNQIRVISYGEERPEGMGHEEDSWSLNRRAVFVYTSR